MSKVLFVHVDVADPISGPPLYGDWFAFIRPNGYIAVCVYFAGTLCLWSFTKCAAKTTSSSFPSTAAAAAALLSIRGISPVLTNR